MYIAFGAAVIQFILVSLSFPIGELLTRTPLFHIDGAFHGYQMKLGVNLANLWKVVGYDPYFNAGYPGGVIYNRSAKFPTVLAVVVQPWFNEVLVYKWYVFISAVVAPLCVSVALHCFRLNARVTLIGTALGIFLWWASQFHWFHTAGMVAFVTGSYLSLPFMAVLVKELQKPTGYRTVIILGLLGGLGIFYHPLFPLPIIVTTLTYLGLARTDLDWRRVLFVLAVVSVLSILPNVWWLYLMHYFQTVFKEGGDDPYQKLVDISVVWREFIGLWTGTAHGSKAYAPITFAAVWACMGARTQREKTLALSFTISGVVLVLFAAVGAAFGPFGQLQPNRFAPVGYLFLCVPAAIGMEVMLVAARDSLESWRFWGARLSLILMAMVGGYLVNEIRREISYADIGHYGMRPPEVKPEGEYSRWLLKWLKQHTTWDGRILFEESRGRVYDGANISGYYAYESNREFIGGPYPAYPFMHFAGFWDGWLFNKKISDIGQEQFLKYMDLYNVGWIVAHSDESKRFLHDMPGIVPAGKLKQVEVYSVNRSHSYFFAGSGKVLERGHNNIVLDDLLGDRVILKYHYVEGLTSQPSVRLLPIKLSDDPNPFIMIVNPPPKQRIRIFFP